MIDVSILMNYPHSTVMKVNYLKVPVTVLEPNDENMIIFNKIYEMCLENNLPPIKRTKSGGISIKIGNLRDSFDIRYTNNLIEMTVFLLEGCWRIQFRYMPRDPQNENKRVILSGHRAFEIFKQFCAKHNVDLDQYKVSNAEGKEIKKEIEKPLIDVEKMYINKDVRNAYHIDFHSSYPGGLVNTHPEFGPVIDELYDRRKEDNGKYKIVLNATVGFMQANYRPQYAVLSRDAIKDNNDRIKELAQRLRKKGYHIIAYNTDGIWYRDLNLARNQPYHGEGEGTRPGQWTNDIEAKRLRYKSKGCYEYIDEEGYHPVVRGLTYYDRVKPRSEWQWGDIYRNDVVVIKYAFVEGIGIINTEAENEI